MELSNDLISQFVKATNDTKQENKESTVQGTVVISDGKTFVKLNNSEQLTPVTTTTAVKNNDKVNVLIKNHTATITGNITVPATNSENVANQINEFGILIGDKLVTEEMTAEIAKIDTLMTDNVTIKERLDASEADITDLTAENATITGQLNAAKGDIEDLNTAVFDAVTGNIKFASIGELNAATAEINNIKGTYATIENLEARDADITNLKTAVFDAKTGNIKFANIDFSNISKATIEKLFSDSGIIKDLVIGDGTVTGEIVGVTIRGDQIIAGTIAANKIVIRGDDGILYKLNTDGLTEVDIQELEKSETETETLKNSIHGSKIIANTITAEKVSVSDLVAFGATIGGFNITNKAIYSGVKNSVDNELTGIYLDRNGQISIGNISNFIRYGRDYSELSVCSNIIDKLLGIISEVDDMSEITSDIETLKSKFTNIEHFETNDITDIVKAINTDIDNIREKLAAFSTSYAEKVDLANAQIDALIDHFFTFSSSNYKLEIKVDDITIGSDASVIEEIERLNNSTSSIENDIEELQKSVELKMDENGVKLSIEQAINDGIKSVSTNTGYTFDDNGLIINKSNSEISTTITENGMAVKKNNKEVLTANANGVNAKDLKASTYLIIGENSRFEDYGTDRTGCFWIGE